MNRAAALLALIAALSLVAVRGPLAPGSARACGTHGPFDFDTFEYGDSWRDYEVAIGLAAEGNAIAGVLQVGTETIDVRFQGLESGPRDARVPASTAHRVPPSLFKSIVWVESTWWNADSTTIPDSGVGAVGPVLRSFDCGFGLAQVTTGMYNNTGTASAKQAAVGSHALFNLAEGVRILADKWNSAPQWRPIAGNGDPAALEDWYFAVWAYNGFWFGNHPFYPNLDPLRGGGEPSPLYHCWEPTALSYVEDAFGYVVYGYGDYTYPERVYGCLRYPPRAREITTTQSLSSATLALSHFEPGQVAVVHTGDGDCVNLRPSPGTSEAPIACLAEGTKVTILGGPEQAGGLTWWRVTTPAGTGWMVDDFLVPEDEVPTPTPPPGPTPVPSPPPPVPTPPALGGTRMWQPLAFYMPDFGAPAVASAFAPANFIACDDRNFAGGCAAMDYPTTIPDRGVRTYGDPTPRTDPAQVSRFIGAPALAVAGPATVTVRLGQDGKPPGEGPTVDVHNRGTGVGPFRIVASDPWIVVRHKGDPEKRTLDASVAIGTDIEVVTQRNPLKTTAGYTSKLFITVDPTRLPEGGEARGTVVIEPLFGTGGPFLVNVVVGGPGSTPHRLFVPGVTASGP